MKKLLTIILLIGFFSSCDDLLEEVPNDFISRANFYKNATDAEAAVTGAYSSFYHNYGITYWLFLVSHADYENGRGSQAPISDFSKVLDVGSVGRAASIWSSFYITINRTNSILENVPAIEMDENLETRFLAEAHFLRAMSYFNLVRGFGPVPLKTMESTDVSTIGAVRAPEDAIYELIIQDCQTAINGLPESVGDETGRASKYAAKMLLAEVYLTRENWSEAAHEANDIISSNQYQLVHVAESDDFYNIFAVNTSSEDIL